MAAARWVLLPRHVSTHDRFVGRDPTNRILHPIGAERILQAGDRRGAWAGRPIG